MSVNKEIVNKSDPILIGYSTSSMGNVTKKLNLNNSQNIYMRIKCCFLNLDTVSNMDTMLDTNMYEKDFLNHYRKLKVGLTISLKV